MRDATLKRLDEILADDFDRCDGLEPKAWQELRTEWLALRDELVDERCENCLYAEMTHSADERGWLKCRGLSLSNAGGATLCCDPGAELLVSRSFYCGHFEAKK
jgi:hypothetical protein